MKKDLLTVLQSPFSYLFLLFYWGATGIQHSITPAPPTESIFTFVLFFLILPGWMWFITKRSKIGEIQIHDPGRESIWVVGYFFGWLALYLLAGNWLMDEMLVSNLAGFWGLLVVVPFVFFSIKKYKLADFGISLRHWKKNGIITLLAGVPIVLLLLGMTPGGRFLLDNDLSRLSLIKGLGLAFGMAFFLAGFFEEFFFRAVLQTRLSQALKSKWSGIVLASILFGIYHLPFQYYGTGPAAGDWTYALSNVLTEQMFTALIFGILWARTHNLMAPVIVHSLIDMISHFPRVIEMFNLQ